MHTLNPNLIQLTDYLNAAAYCDGTRLGEALGISRAAVWKMIKKLQHYGVAIDSSRSKGYALQGPCILLDHNKLFAALPPETSKTLHIDIFESLDSTNRYLKQSTNTHPWHFCLAETQLQGKGRLQRVWHSPFGQNMYLSCRYQSMRGIAELNGLSLVVAFALVTTLKHYDIQTKIKWPNDIVYEGKKLAGTLIEIIAESHGSAQAIIGVGLNINMQRNESQTIDQAWTSMQTLTGKNYDRNTVIATFIHALQKALIDFSEHGYAHLIDEWQQYDALDNQPIQLQHQENTVTGIARGINAQGHLRVELSPHEIQTFACGDVSCRAMTKES